MIILFLYLLYHGIIKDNNNYDQITEKHIKYRLHKNQ